MNEELLKNVAGQVPALVVLVIMVTFFLKHLRASESDQMDARKHSREVIERNTKAAEAMTGALRELAKELERKQ
jgi:hypothetical protein